MSATPLIVTADDYGLTDATSRVILDLHRAGSVTATSVLAVAPDVRRRLAWLEEAPDLSVGVHLALVGEDPPLLAASEVPSLVDGRGRLPRSWRQLLPRLAAGRIDSDDVRRELDAQVQLVAGARHPSHLDSHQHVHLWPSIAAVVIDLAVRNGIGAIRVPRPTRRSVRNALLARLAEQLDRRAGTAGLERTARFRGLDEAGHWDAAGLAGALEDAAGGSGSLEVNVHPGAATDPDRSRFDWGYRWDEERRALESVELPALAQRLGFVLVGR